MPRSTPVSLLERYTLARGNVGHAQIINLLISFPRASDLPSRTHLETNIRLVLQAFPGLTCRVQEQRTRSPYLEEQELRFVENLILCEDQQITGNTTAARLLVRGTKHTGLRDITGPGPLWRVTRYVSTNGSGPTYLALDAHHAVTDGTGAGVLLEMLLLPFLALRTILDPIIATKPSLAPRLEEIVETRPGTLHLLRVVARELVIPRLPGMLRRVVSQDQPWPTNEAHAGYLSRTPSMLAWPLPAETVIAAKTAAKARGVSTLHPLIHLAAAFAVWAIVTADATDDALRIGSGSPVSLRKTDPAFPLTSGNFFGVYHWATSLAGSTVLWSEMQRYAADLASPAGRGLCRAEIGMIDYIPDPAQYKPHHPQDLDCTGWEGFLLDKASSQHPVTESFVTSNIGRLSGLPAGVGEVYLYQQQSPFGAAFELKAVGAPNGNIGITLAWLEGGPVTLAKAERFERIFRGVFGAIAQDRIGADANLAEIREMLGEKA